MVYQRGDGRAPWFVALPTRTGRVKRSTGTTHKGTARAIERMLEELGPSGQRAWDLLDRVLDYRLSLGDLFDAFSKNDIEGLRLRLRDADERRREPDLDEQVAGWSAWLVDRVRPDTVAHYIAHLRTLIPEGVPHPRAQFTATAVAQWLAARTRLTQKRRKAKVGSRRKDDPPPRPVTAATKRKYLAAVQSFAGYLVEMGVLPTNIVRDVQAPPQARPRAVELELADVKRIVEGSVAPFRALFALLYGCGIEVSAALACVEGDVDAKRREVRARGTKAHTRDRVVRVAEWAWPDIEKHVEALTPGERLFRGIDRWQVGKVHGERLRALGLPHHRVHDARHFYAVRAVRAGTPYARGAAARTRRHPDGRQGLREVRPDEWRA